MANVVAEGTRTLALIFVLGALALFFALPQPSYAALGVASQVGGTATGTLGGQFNSPRGIAVNETGAGGVPAGSLFVVDGNNNRIQQLEPDGDFVQAFGRDVIQAGKPGDLGVAFEVCTVAANCKAGASSGLGDAFSNAQGIAIDQSDGSLYVTEQGNRRVSKYVFSGGTPVFDRAWGWDVLTGGVTTFEVCAVAAECKAGASGAGAGQFGATIGHPAVNPTDGSVYVADPANRRVQRFTSAGAFSYAFGWDVDPSGGSGELEKCTAICQSGTGGSGLGQFSLTGAPSRVAVDATGVTYTVEPAFSTNGKMRVQRFNATSTSASVFAPAYLSGTSASLAANNPTDVQVSRIDGTVFVAKAAGIEPPRTNERRILELDPSGKLLAVHAEGDGIPTGTGFGLAVNALSGRLYATANHRVFILMHLPDPVATIDPVTGITGTTATFSGSVDPTGYETGYRFEYVADEEFLESGFTKAESVPTPEGSAGSGEGAVPVTETATDLLGSTLYHVRLLATKRYLGGAVAATDATAPLTFTTEPSAPRIRNAEAREVTDPEATLAASLNPANQATTWHFEYVEDAEFQANGYANAISTPVPEADGGSGGQDFAAVRKLTGLQPATTYHFRLLATNATGTTESPDTTFTTYPDQSAEQGCPNAAIRAAQGSTYLPDCRAYELVSSRDANGLFLTSEGSSEGIFFTPLVDPSGESAVFFTAAGELPGFDTNGLQGGYRSVRNASGWSIEALNPSGGQAVISRPGGISADHQYMAFGVAANGGSLDVPGTELDSYLRGPGGIFEPVGQGSLGIDPTAEPRWVTADAEHSIFSTGSASTDPPIQLEPTAPPDGIRAIYDRTPDGTTHVVSLLPGEVTPTESANYKGASADGSTVVFKIADDASENGGTMYVRRNNSATYQVATEMGGGFDDPRFAGISDDGDRVFYFSRTANPYGDLFAFDVDTQTTIPIAGNGAATPVNISADGSHVYFISTEQLDGSNGTVGADNLYLWDGTDTRFIAEVPHSDLTGFYGSTEVHLAQWIEAVRTATPQTGPGISPTRSTPDGSVLVFESHGELTGQDSDGHSQLFRYDANADSLECVSCSPTGAPATSDAALRLDTTNVPTLRVNVMRNLSDDGDTVFFHTADALAPRDVNGQIDVYEWHEGKLRLISSGRSANASYMTGMSADGSSVFFKTHEALVPEDENAGSGAIYVARVDGGFPSLATINECSGDSCQGSPLGPPTTSTPGSSFFSGPGNQAKAPRKKCGKHKRRNKRGRCVARKRHVKKNAGRGK